MSVLPHRVVLRPSGYNGFVKNYKLLNKCNMLSLVLENYISYFEVIRNTELLTSGGDGG